jgi:hypothetical protein
MTWNYEDEPPVSPRAMSTLRSGDRPSDRVEEEAVRAMRDMGLVRATRPRRERGWLDGVYMALAASVVFAVGVGVGHVNAVSQSERDIRRVANYVMSPDRHDFRAQSLLRRAGWRDRRAIEMMPMIDSIAVHPSREHVSAMVAAEMAHADAAVAIESARADFEVVKSVEPTGSWAIGDVMVEARDLEGAEVSRTTANGAIRTLTLRLSDGVVVIRDRSTGRPVPTKR